jgi:hypothetical protein
MAASAPMKTYGGGKSKPKPSKPLDKKPAKK